MRSILCSPVILLQASWPKVSVHKHRHYCVVRVSCFVCMCVRACVRACKHALIHTLQETPIHNVFISALKNLDTVECTLLFN